MKRRAIVIGSTGGIGAALVRALERRDWAVTGLSRHSDPPLDLTDEAGIAAAASTLSGEAPFDLVFVATGMLHDGAARPEKSVRDLALDGLAESFAVNAIGPALVARYFLPLLPRDRRAVFAALSARVGSIADNRLGGWYGYRASKAALNQIIRTLSIELARTRPEAIILGLHPGTVDTKLSAPFQRGVKTLFTPEVAATYLIDVIERAGPADTGRCLAWDGSLIVP